MGAGPRARFDLRLDRYSRWRKLHTLVSGVPNGKRLSVDGEALAQVGIAWTVLAFTRLTSRRPADTQPHRASGTGTVMTEETPSPQSSSWATLLGQLADDFTARQERGEAPSVEE